MAIHVIDFYIKGKIITVDKATLPPDDVVGDNADYAARFFFDEGWTGRGKTARFVGRDETYKDVVLVDDSCAIPVEVMKGGLVLVGVFAGDLQTTTPARFPVRASILDREGLPADPTPEVYAQLMKLLNDIKEGEVSDEDIQAAVNAYMEKNPPLTLTTITAEDVQGG